MQGRRSASDVLSETAGIGSVNSGSVNSTVFNIIKSVLLGRSWIYVLNVKLDLPEFRFPGIIGLSIELIENYFLAYQLG